MGETYNVQFNADFDISAVKGAVSQLNNLFENSANKIPKSFANAFKKIGADIKELEKLQSDKTSKKDRKKIEGLSDSIQREIRSLNTEFSALQKSFKLDANNFLPKEFLSDLKQAKKLMEDFSKASKPSREKDENYDKLAQQAADAKRAKTVAEKKVRNLREKTAKIKYDPSDYDADHTRLEANAKKAKEEYNKVKDKNKRNSTAAAIGYEEGSVQDLKALDAIHKKEAQIAKKREEQAKRQERAKQNGLDAVASRTKDGTTHSYKQLIERADEEIAELEQKKNRLAQLRQEALQANKDWSNARDTSDKETSQAKSRSEQANKELRDLEKQKGLLDQKAAAEKELAEATQKYDKADAAKRSVENQYSAEALKNLISQLKGLKNLDLPELDGLDFDKITQALDKIKTDKVAQATAEVHEMGQAVESVGDSANKAGDKVEKFTHEFDLAEEKAQEAENLKRRMVDFFSISNAIQIFKTAIRDAFETVKDLDAAMTETAVVTNYSVGDMWEKLPEYTKVANELGTTTQGAYETMTLFYQQGLNTEQAFGVGTEAMKMARIAGLDYANATNLMTAALRGFNMEIDQQSATKVNDVYSKLAAITAADTKEIATAMTKTASIANSAGMDFETTSAFLSQIIETTRESAETAGTAMKTVVARFQELRKSPDEIGEIEGEIVDANKIEAALRTVGVSLRDNVTGQFRNLDDVFLELASKWSSLDTNTQRYIATIAAGSRQQSRFIAMMSDYDRTMELVDAANHSAGASEEQFGKTLDSLESKINRLKNAWAEFTMGLANNEFIKTGTDLLTSLLNVINKITSIGGNSGFGKILTSVLRTGGAFLGLKAGSGLLGGAFESFSNKKKGIYEKGVYRSNMLKEFQGLINFGSNKGIFGVTPKKIKSIFSKGLEEASNSRSLSANVKNKFAKGKQTGFFVNDQGIVTTDPKTFNVRGTRPLTLDYNGPNFKGFYGSEADKKVLAEAFPHMPQGYQKQQMSRQRIKFKTLPVAEDGTPIKPAALPKKAGSRKGSYRGNLRVGHLPPEVSTPKAASAMGALKSGLMGIGKGIVAGLAIAATVKAISFAIEKAIQFSSKGQLEIAKGASAQSAHAAEQANKAYKELDNTIEDLGKKKKNIDNLTKGTEEWKEAVAENNEEISGLMRDHPELAAFRKLDNDGVMSLDLNQINDQGQTGHQVIQKTKNALKQQEAYSNAAAAAENRRAAKRQVEVLTNDFIAGMSSALDPYTDLSYVAQSIADDAYSGKLTKKQFATMDRWGKTYEEFWKLGQDRAQQKQEVDFANKQILNSAFESMNLTGVLEKEFSQLDQDLFAGILAKTEKEKDVGAWVTNKDKERWAEAKGYTWDHRAGYDKYYDKEGNEVKVGTDWASISAELTAIDAIEAMKGEDGALAKSLDWYKKLDGNQQEIASRVFSADGTGLKKEDFAQYYKRNEDDRTLILDENNNPIVDMEKVAESFGYEADNRTSAFTKMAKDWGLEVDEMASIIEDNFASGRDRIEDVRKNLITSAVKSKYFQANGKDPYAEANRLFEQIEQSHGEEYTNQLSMLFEEVQKTNDQTIVDTITREFINLSKQPNASTNQLKELAKTYREINWNNPIKAFKEINRLASSGGKEVQKIANRIKQSEPTFFSIGNQVRYLAKSSSFGDLEKDIRKIAKSNGDISASDVLDLADSYEDLQGILDNATGSAEGLAEVLERIASGELSLDELTDSVVAFAEGQNRVGGVIAETLKSVQGFKITADESEIGSFLSKAYGDIKERTDAKAWGNSAIDQYYDYIFGSDWDKKDGVAMSGRDYENRIMQGQEWLKANETTMRPTFENLMQGKRWDGTSANVDAETQSWLKNLSHNADGSVHVGEGFYAGKTTDQLITSMQSVLGGSREMIGMLISMMSQSSSNMKQSLTSEDYEYSKQKAIEAKQAAPNGQKYMDSSEIEAMHELNGYKTVEGMKADFRNEGIQITDFKEAGTDNYKSIQEIKSQIQEMGIGPQKKSYSVDGGEAQAAFDFTGLKEQLATLPLPEAYKTELADLMMDSSLNAGDCFVATLEDGSKALIKLQEDQTASQAIAIEEAARKAATLTDAISNGFLKAIAALDGKYSGPAQEALQPPKQSEVVELVPDDTLVNEKLSETGEKPVNLEGDPEGVNNAIDEAKDTKTVHIYGVWHGYALPGHAKGIKNSPTKHTALVGEGNGPELVQKKEGYYIAGTNGPELANIEKGDTVYTAEQTRKILKSSSKTLLPRHEDGFDAFKPGFHNPGSKPNRGSGSRGSKKDKEEKPWDNPFDALYNLLRQIDEQLRERNRIERSFQNELKSLNTNARKLADLTVKELAQLDFEKQAQQALRDRRNEQIDKFEKENSSFNQYAKTETDPITGERVLRIDWEAINEVTDQETGKDIEEYVKQLEEWTDDINKAEETLNDIDDKIEEIKEQRKEDYLKAENRIKEALLKVRQQEIEQLQKIGDSITDSNSKIISAMEKSISKMREERENEKTEKDLQEKYRRLGYLSQDTSNANDLEIFNLEKELEEQQEDYTNTLIDQKITQLQDQNDFAADQRNQEIEILNTQLEQYEKTGAVFEDVQELLHNSIGADGNIIDGSNLENLLKKADNWSGLSKTMQTDWAEKFQNEMTSAMAYIWSKDSKFQGDIGKIVETVQGVKNVMDNNEKGKSSGGSGGGGSGGGSSSGSSGGSVAKPETYPVYKFSNGRVYTSGTTTNASFSTYTKRVADGLYSKYWASHRKGHGGGKGGTISKYASGGLADFTGPAWLDGTKSKPELVLNARDTQNFIQLKDILGNFMNNKTSSAPQNSGEISYDIDINVEKISDDYDVEKIADKIKRLINADARYRNNNTIGSLR